MNNKNGFTLIELLIVIAIIGVLSAIAIPQFARYRANTYCSLPINDARNAVIAMEAYFAESFLYGPLADTGFRSSRGVTTIVVSTDPLTVASTDETGNCPLGGTYTLDQPSGTGSWS